MTLRLVGIEIVFLILPPLVVGDPALSKPQAAMLCAMKMYDPDGLLFHAHEVRRRQTIVITMMIS